MDMRTLSRRLSGWDTGAKGIAFDKGIDGEEEDVCLVIESVGRLGASIDAGAGEDDVVEFTAGHFGMDGSTCNSLDTANGYPPCNKSTVRK